MADVPIIAEAKAELARIKAKDKLLEQISVAEAFLYRQGIPLD